MRLFRFENDEEYWWVFADDEDEARDISLDEGMAKSTDEINLIGDQTEFYRTKNPTNIDEVKQKGIAALKLESDTPMNDIRSFLKGELPPSQKPPAKKRWTIVRNGNRYET